MLKTPLDLLSLIFVPFIGILVRYRVAYHPTPPITSADTEPALNTDGEGAPNSLTRNEPPVVEPIPTYRGLWRKVKEMEGWNGLFKGFLPTLLWNIILPFFWFRLNGTKIYMSPSPTTLDRSFHSALFYNAFFCIGLIFVYRSIMTTHKLRFTSTNVSAALNALFTDYERKKPWVLWLIPGLVPALIINITLQVFVFIRLRRLISHEILPSEPMSLAYSTGVCLFSTIILAPLDVVVTRLAIQHNHGPPTAVAASVFLDVEAQDLEKKGSETAKLETETDQVTPVVQLRKEPYLGLYDCIKKIIHEEGWQALYRGWWVTALGNFIL
ncbi:hypothetical protein BDZ94DRAFT_1318136 [Collybia nuda]|uniref:Mitochondrial carrier n=1 Tax=Collybia nuda TaxID=64659 RepID=A0A9P6CIV0_9AGAR|nr:hypothetical protein BDZ94DRAFT_1318136 [Collybia nuda]